jgi:hypothetical protein
MKKYNDYELGEIAYKNWEKEARDQIKYIKTFVDDGKVKFENVEELGYEIKGYLNMSGEWDEGDLLFDFTDQAKEILEELSVSLV